MSDEGFGVAATLFLALVCLVILAVLAGQRDLIFLRNAQNSRADLGSGWHVTKESVFFLMTFLRKQKAGH